MLRKSALGMDVDTLCDGFYHVKHTPEAGRPPTSFLSPHKQYPPTTAVDAPPKAGIGAAHCLRASGCCRGKTTVGA